MSDEEKVFLAEEENKSSDEEDRNDGENRGILGEETEYFDTHMATEIHKMNKVKPFKMSYAKKRAIIGALVTISLFFYYIVKSMQDNHVIEPWKAGKDRIKYVEASMEERYNVNVVVKKEGYYPHKEKNVLYEDIIYKVKILDRKAELDNFKARITVPSNDEEMVFVEEYPTSLFYYFCEQEGIEVNNRDLIYYSSENNAKEYAETIKKAYKQMQSSYIVEKVNNGNNEEAFDFVPFRLLDKDTNTYLPEEYSSCDISITFDAEGFANELIKSFSQ
jgi:hypothetical protein